ncbi:MAG: 50S ribosomal protein L17 [Thermoanaerobaculia bacterium]|nr:50S ribosomal protein L17 [Thermoanaerobaculia bacterium]
MRHNQHGRKLGRTSSHRKALFRNQLSSLVEHERIKTTLHKAKELRPLAERLVTQGRKDTVAARRQVRRWVESRTLVKKLFDEIAPRFVDRPGGYTRIVKLGPRLGDQAEMALLEFVEGPEAAEPADTKRGKKKKK